MPAPADPALVDLVKTVLLPGGIGASILALVLGWRKGTGGAKAVEATVVSAAIADAAAIRSLVDALQHNTGTLITNRAESIVAHAEEQASRARLGAAMDELAAAIRRNGLPPDWLAALGNIKG